MLARRGDLPHSASKPDMNRREFLVRTVAAAVALALAGSARAGQSAARETRCPQCGVTIWRGNRAHLLASLGRDEQDDYCLSCLTAMDKQQVDWEEYLNAFFARSSKQAAPCRRNRTGREPCR